MSQMVIWKFPLTPDESGRCVVSIPQIKTYLGVGQQHGELVLWAAVDPNERRHDCKFLILGTGFEVPPTAAYYRGTVQMPNGLVWHVMQEAT